MRFLATTIDLPRHMYSVQSYTAAQVLARLVYILMVSIEYGVSGFCLDFGVLETFWKHLFVFRNACKKCFVYVLETVLETLISPRMMRYAAMA
jgi:hypothetical protein